MKKIFCSHFMDITCTFTHTRALVITVHPFAAHPHFLAHQAFFLAQQLPVPLLRYSGPLHLPHLSVCLFCSHSSDSSSQYLNQIDLPLNHNIFTSVWQ